MNDASVKLRQSTQQLTTVKWRLSIATSEFITHLLILLCRLVSSKVQCDFAELFEGSFKIFDDFLGEHVGIGKVIGLFEAFVSEPEDVEARLSRLIALRNCKPPMRLSPLEFDSASST